MDQERNESPGVERTLASNDSLGELWLERLVDGELSDDEQQRIVSALDRIPQGWRQCALGFLEAQAWRRALRALHRSPPGQRLTVADDPPAVAAVPAAHLGASRADAAAADPSRPRSSTGLPWLSLAASVALAFWAGQLAHWPATNVGRFPDKDLVAADTATPARSPVRHAPAVVPARTQFVTNDFWQGEPAIPSDIRKILKQMGARVQQRSGYVPGKAANGQAVLVPYEEVHLVPVTHHPY